jgi:hypothetical protein
MEREGYSWAFSQADGDTVFITFGDPSIYRFANALIGNVETNKRNDITIRDDVPDHFGYGEYQTLGESFDEDKYFVITKSNILTFTELWTAMDRYSKRDLVQLETDPTVARLYSNGELEIYRVSSTRG